MNFINKTLRIAGRRRAFYFVRFRSLKIKNLPKQLEDSFPPLAQLKRLCRLTTEFR